MFKYVATVVLVFQWSINANAQTDSLIIKAGFDLFYTTGAGKHFGFAPTDDAKLVIPGMVFGDGYSDFGELMVLKGKYLTEYNGIPLPIPDANNPLHRVDTIIERIQDAKFNKVGDQAKIEIRMVDLGMQSIEPIIVNGPNGVELWDVEIRATNSPKGSMTIKWLHSGSEGNGGTYDAIIPVDGIFTFTRVTDKIERQLDGQKAGVPTLFFIINDIPWMDRVVLTGPAHHPVDSNAISASRKQILESMNALTLAQSVQTRLSDDFIKNTETEIHDVEKVKGLTSNFIPGYSASMGRLNIKAEDLIFGGTMRRPGSGWHAHMVAPPRFDLTP